nr:MAG TPA: hypothetical protein [Caudoviricetes sp.]
MRSLLYELLLASMKLSDTFPCEMRSISAYLPLASNLKSITSLITIYRTRTAKILVNV